MSFPRRRESSGLRCLETPAFVGACFARLASDHFSTASDRECFLSPPDQRVEFEFVSQRISSQKASSVFSSQAR